MDEALDIQIELDDAKDDREIERLSANAEAIKLRLKLLLPMPSKSSKSGL